MTRTLRDYQAEGVAAIYDEWRGAVTRTACVMATGLGKTDLIAKVATDTAAQGRPVLILAHRAELLDQIIERCHMHNPTITVGRVQGAVNQHRRQIVVAMEPTLRNTKRRARILPPAALLDGAGNVTRPAGVVIVDECHHAASAGYVKVLKWAGCLPDDNHPGRPLTPLLGVTATFTRGDKRGLGDVFESVAVVRDIAWAITHGPLTDDGMVSGPVGTELGQAPHGWLTRPHGRVVVGEHVKLEQAKVSSSTKDYAEAELGEMVAQDVEHIVHAWQTHAVDAAHPAGRLTAAFTPSVDSAKALAYAFRAAGVPVGEVYGDTPRGERLRTYADLAAGRIRALVGVAVMTEGWDCPPVSCVLMARPTKLPGLYAQIVGRGLRLAPGKTDCLVLDVVGASRTMRLLTLIDLIPTAAQNLDEVLALPCDVCGGHLAKSIAARADALRRGLDPCTCQCSDCREPLADCVCGRADRDPDGGRRRLRGPAVYADVDLLAGVNAGSDLNWLVTPGGVSFVGAGKYLVAVTPAAQPDRFNAGYLEAWGNGDGEDLALSVPLAEARDMVERFADDNGAQPRTAPWRLARKRPSDAAQQVAARLGIGDPASYTAGGLADAIDLARATRRFDG